MTTVELELDCRLCTHKDGLPKLTVDLPEGWVGDKTASLGNTSHPTILCPKHAKAEDFFDKQCAGCVGGPGDCPLWASFAFEHVIPGGRVLLASDFDSLRCGICPRRVNGTLSVLTGRDGRVIEEMRLDEKASDGAGEVVAEAILDYMREYGSGKVRA